MSPLLEALCHAVLLMGARTITTHSQTYSTIQETCYPGRNQTETAPPGQNDPKLIQRFATLLHLRKTEGSALIAVY